MKYFKLLLALLVLCFCGTLTAQEIINVTSFPKDAVQYRDIYNIEKIDGKVIVPLYGSDNDTYEYLPNMPIDSFDSPPASGMSTVRSTLFAEYAANGGFVDKNIVHYSIEPTISLDGDYLSLTHKVYPFGINNNFVYNFPGHIDSSKTIISVFDTSVDSFVYFDLVALDRDIELVSDIDGDYIYVNIALVRQDDDDLIFMGDTLIYPFESFGENCNYLTKINFKTGVKEWIRHIGYGKVHKVLVDDSDRINIEMEGANPAVYEYERIYPDESTLHNGWYDRLMYRVDQEGNFIQKTRICTLNESSNFYVEMNSDGSFQAYGSVTSPKYIIVEADSIDFLDVTSAEDGKGLVLAFDADYNYLWGRKLSAYGESRVRAMMRSSKGDYIVSMMCECDSIEIDGSIYEGPPKPPGSPNVPLIRRGSLVLFDHAGNLKGSPYVGYAFETVEDIQELDADHYLTVFRRWGTGGFHFLGKQFAGDITFIEYKGDVFDVMTTIDEYTLSDDIVVFPNPTKSGADVSIHELDNSQLYNIKLFNESGQICDRTTISTGVYRTPITLASGIYYLQVIHEKVNRTITLYIK